MPSLSALLDRYESPMHKRDTIELSADRYEAGIERGDDGAWGVGALVVSAGRVLFVREGETWLLPGGKLHADESVEAGARREVREETGIDVELSTLGAVAEQTFRHPERDDSYQFYFATFVAEPRPPEPEPTAAADAVDEAAWLQSVPESTFDRELVVRLVERYVSG